MTQHCMGLIVATSGQCCALRVLPNLTAVRTYKYEERVPVWALLAADWIATQPRGVDTVYYPEDVIDAGTSPAGASLAMAAHLEARGYQVEWRAGSKRRLRARAAWADRRPKRGAK